MSGEPTKKSLSTGISDFATELLNSGDDLPLSDRLVWGRDRQADIGDHISLSVVTHVDRYSEKYQPDLLLTPEEKEMEGAVQKNALAKRVQARVAEAVSAHSITRQFSRRKIPVVKAFEGFDGNYAIQVRRRVRLSSDDTQEFVPTATMLESAAHLSSVPLRFDEARMNALLKILATDPKKTGLSTADDRDKLFSGNCRRILEEFGTGASWHSVWNFVDAQPRHYANDGATHPMYSKGMRSIVVQGEDQPIDSDTMNWWCGRLRAKHNVSSDVKVEKWARDVSENPVDAYVEYGMAAVGDAIGLCKAIDTDRTDAFVDGDVTKCGTNTQLDLLRGYKHLKSGINLNRADGKWKDQGGVLAEKIIDLCPCCWGKDVTVDQVKAQIGNKIFPAAQYSGGAGPIVEKVCNATRCKLTGRWLLTKDNMKNICYPKLVEGLLAEAEAKARKAWDKAKELNPKQKPLVWGHIQRLDVLVAHAEDYWLPAWRGTFGWTTRLNGAFQKYFKEHLRTMGDAPTVRFPDGWNNYLGLWRRITGTSKYKIEYTDHTGRKRTMSLCPIVYDEKGIGMCAKVMQGCDAFCVRLANCLDGREGINSYSVHDMKACNPMEFQRMQRNYVRAVNELLRSEILAQFGFEELYGEHGIRLYPLNSDMLIE